MKRVRLHQTDLYVSPICLGTVNYGSTMTDADAMRQMSRFAELGGNFFDTARIYGVWAGRGEALAERIIGRWLKETSNRQNVVISTKGGHPEWESLGVMRLEPKDIERDIEESLRHLGIETIDLYFLHRDDPSVLLEDILGCLEKARLSGKIRHYGCSNWKLERILSADKTAKREGFEGFICNQLMWSLADICTDGIQDKALTVMDASTHAYHEATGMNVMAYTSLAKGYFVRRAQDQTLQPPMMKLYDNAGNKRIGEMMEEYKRDPVVTPLNASLSYFGYHKFPSIAIASFSSDQQLVDAMQCCEHPVASEIMQGFGALKDYVV